MAIPLPEAPARLLPLEEALERMLDGVAPLPLVRVSLTASRELLGAVIADDVAALVTMPPWDDSAMDGFAVVAADVASATAERPVMLRVLGESAAGRPTSIAVASGTAVRILTGAPLPDGADAVVPVESTDAPRGMAALPATVAVTSPVTPGAHLRRAGSDLVAGMPVIAAGTVIAPRHVGVLVAAGHADVAVHRRPRVAIVSTGDELTDPGTSLGPGRIHDSNGPGIAAQVTAMGGVVAHVARAPDDLTTVEAELRAACDVADVVIVTGGVSVGAHDVVKEAFDRLGTIDLWRVAIQPGKPLAFGRADASDGRAVLLFGLPGNPVSSFVTFELFVRPVLRRLAGRRAHLERDVVSATLADDVSKSPNRRAFLRVTVEPTRDASTTPWVARLAGGQGSHVLSALANADGLAIIPEELDGLPAGAVVDVWRLDGSAG